MRVVVDADSMNARLREVIAAAADRRGFRATVVLAAFESAKVAAPTVTVQLENWEFADGVAVIGVAAPT